MGGIAQAEKKNARTATDSGSKKMRCMRSWAPVYRARVKARDPLWLEGCGLGLRVMVWVGERKVLPCWSLCQGRSFYRQQETIRSLTPFEHPLLAFRPSRVGSDGFPLVRSVVGDFGGGDRRRSQRLAAAEALRVWVRGLTGSIASADERERGRWAGALM